MQAQKKKPIDPYRIFFPVSILGAIAGVTLWVLAWNLQKRLIDVSFHSYPVFQHINIMTSLFLLPAAKGFIFTAIPRFTGTDFLNGKEIFTLSGLQFLVLTFVFFYEDSLLFYSIQFLDFGLLFLFIIHRFKISKVNLSDYLYFLSGGIFLGFLGSLLHLGSMFFEKTFLFQFGKDFIFYGMVPCIIFGTGTRIIPMIVNAENPMKKMEWMQSAESQKFTNSFLIVFIFSFILEVIASKFISPNFSILSKGIRFIICSYWIIKFFHIFEFSSFKGKLATMLLLACYLFIIGLAGYSFGFQYSSHLAHIYLIGGLSLLILSIMTRVTLSHGGGDMAIEQKANLFYWIGGIIFLSALTRAFVFLSPSQSVTHLSYAALLFIIAFLIWFIKIGRFIFK